jgi:hypothetical protein
MSKDKPREDKAPRKSAKDRKAAKALKRLARALDKATGQPTHLTDGKGAGAPEA